MQCCELVLSMGTAGESVGARYKRREPDVHFFHVPLCANAGILYADASPTELKAACEMRFGVRLVVEETRVSTSVRVCALASACGPSDSEGPWLTNLSLRNSAACCRAGRGID